jgi:hypothetical protein
MTFATRNLLAFQIQILVLFQQIHDDILDFIGFILMSKLVVVPTSKHKIC